MALIHQVYDTDAHFKINPVTRAITNASTGKNVLIQYDHNSERFTFEIPRLIDGHDMAKSTAVEVHYINIDANDKTLTSADIYPVDDLQISPEDENVIICSWLISQNATRYAGSLNFLLKFMCVDESLETVYRWHTAIYSGIFVSSGMNNSTDVVEDYSDVLEAWEGRLDAAEGQFAKTSQGRSASISITKPGWKRILNVIRAHGGSLCLGLGKANSNYGYAFQVLGLEFTGNVNFPGTTEKPINFDTVPVIYQKFNHLMGENNGTDASRKAMITRVRIGYPKRDYKTSPVNCYVDVYVECTQGKPSLLVNYAGFADNHNCTPITEEVTVAENAPGMYDEELVYHEFFPSPGYNLYMPDGGLLAKRVIGDYFRGSAAEFENNVTARSLSADVVSGKAAHFSEELTAGDVRADYVYSQEVLTPKMVASNMPYELIIGTEKKPIILRDLQNGCYYLSGDFLHYAADQRRTLIDGLYVVNRKTTDSIIVRLSPRDMNIRYYTITDKSYKATQMSHADIVDLQEAVADLESRIAALEGN